MATILSLKMNKTNKRDHFGEQMFLEGVYMFKKVCPAVLAMKYLNFGVYCVVYLCFVLKKKKILKIFNNF